MAKSICLSQAGKLNLFYGNKEKETIMFQEDLKKLCPEHVSVDYWLSKEEAEGFQSGRLDKENVTAIVKNDLSLLKADGFYICGPEQMILETVEVLKTFGVSKDKIHYELFTSPVLMKSTPTKVTSDFNGVSKVVVILDDEETDFDLETDGATILEEAESHAIDAPFSCRGGVCCTCKAKVLKGEVRMDSNMSLTDNEVNEGYVLTCQAHPASEEVIISYDE
jgi:ring-1,2-phenylacetyl-CoA epoxidase subunit PaaE